MSAVTQLGVQEPTACYNPATGELIGHSALHSVEDLQRMVERARQAQQIWAATPVSERVRYIQRVRHHVANEADALAQTISHDNGKTRLDALATEVAPAVIAAAYYAKQAPTFLRDRPLKAGSPALAFKRSRIVRVPYGVIAVISPWNYPFGIPFSEVVMGLLAGNAVILKTASQTQLVGRALERCFAQAGVPQGLFAYINLPGRIAGDALLEAGVDKLFFTGSVEVGKGLMAKAAQTLTPLCLELGGNDAMLVCQDADLERASSGALWSGMQNCGQSCGGVERVYVQREVYQPFVDLLASKVRSLRVGRDLDHAVDLGAMTTAAQVKAVQRHIDDAVAKGATVYAESPRPAGSAGNFMSAVLLTDVDHSMEVMRDETFGPVLAVMAVDDMNRAVALANDSHLGLNGSVWSRDRTRADGLARRLQAGAVMINDHMISHSQPETPWGGFKQSGIGRTHGDIGFEEMTQPQCIVHDHTPAARRHLWWFPHNRELYQGLLSGVELGYTRSRGRLRQLSRLLRVVPRAFREISN